MRRTAILLTLGLMIVASGTILAQGDVKDAATIARMNNRGPGHAARSPRGSVGPVQRTRGPIATVGYDTGTVTAQSVSPGARVFGNRFDTYLGSPVGPGNSVTQVTVFVAGASGGIFGTAFDQLNTGAGTANSINDFNWTSTETAINVNALNTWIVANAGEPTPMTFAGSSVLFGLWNTAANTGTDEDAVGLDSSGTTMGQGFHGMQIDFGGANYSTMPSTNAIVRITGPSLPVELTSFQLEDA